MRSLKVSLQLYFYILLLLFICSCKEKKEKQSANAPTSSLYYSDSDFVSVPKINTHVHFNAFDTVFAQQAAADNFRLLTINVEPAYYPPLEVQQEIALRLIKTFPGTIKYATSFSVKNWNSKTWLQETLNYLKASFSKGAIAVKVWKNIGMELRDKDGKFVMIDDPRFDPVLDFIAKNNITLIGHLGEPKNCWLPVEKMTVGNDKRYFTSHPEYHMYLHPEYPSYEDQLNAKDHMLQKHPDLRFVGAHLGSLEWSVDELAKRLDKFPNMAVDMAARIVHFQYQAVNNWQKVHDFFINYQDRIIYATDQQTDGSIAVIERNKQAHASWLSHWKFFCSNDKMKVSEVDSPFNGLKLPKTVIDKIYHDNAEKWIPGLKINAKNNHQ